jgi:hypothetical protein
MRPTVAEGPDIIGAVTIILVGIMHPELKRRTESGFADYWDIINNNAGLEW